MAYKTILVHVDESKHTRMRVEIAAGLASREGAHLIGVAVSGADNLSRRAATKDLLAEGTGLPALPSRVSAEVALGEFARIARRIGVSSIEKRLIDDAAVNAVSLASWFADLVIVGQTDPSEKLLMIEPDFPEYVAMTSISPTLIVPIYGSEGAVGTNILVSWDGSRAARRTIVGALPLMQRASSVQLVTFCPGQQHLDGKKRLQEAGEIALFLARHGVETNLIEQSSSQNSTGGDLMKIAADRLVNLIVMGCYGHSRLSEMLFRGVSRYMLSAMTVPLLMAH